MPIKDNYTVVSLSGGKDSTAMLLRMIERGEKIDEIITCDTYKEFPAMYKHLDKLRAAVANTGIKFTTLRNEKSFDYMMFEFRPKRENGYFGNHPNIKGKSWATSRVRWCTKEMKTRIIGQHLKMLSKEYNVVQCIGIAADESHRIVRKSNTAKNKRMPLVEWGWSEADCLKYCYEKGYDWGGLYETFDRASCWCCPLQSIDSLRKLYLHYPDLWNELKEMDSKTWRQFRADYSIEKLERRFQYENECEKLGLPIRGKAFYAGLKAALMGG